MENWYLLYDGESQDGWGHPKYLTRTLEKKVALKHFDKCKRNPYSIGKVKVITDTSEHVVWSRKELL